MEIMRLRELKGSLFCNLKTASQTRDSKLNEGSFRLLTGKYEFWPFQKWKFCRESGAAGCEI